MKRVPAKRLKAGVGGFGEQADVSHPDSHTQRTCANPGDNGKAIREKKLTQLFDNDDNFDIH